MLLVQELNEQNIKKKITDVGKSIDWLKNNWEKYKVSKNDISTKDMIILKRTFRKTKLSNLVNDYLEKICDETKLELDIILYMLKYCVDDYKSHRKNDDSDTENDIEVNLPNLIIETFNKLWKNLNKSNEISAIKSNLDMIRELALSGKLKEKEFFRDFNPKESEQRYIELQSELKKIRKHVKTLANLRGLKKK